MASGMRWHLASALVIALSTLAPAGTAAANPAPAVTPSIQQWTGGTGSVAFTGDSRIIVDGLSAPQLLADANTLADDVAAIVGHRPLVVIAADPRPTDVVLALDPSVGHADGYRLTVDDAVRIAGASATGVFYGEQSLEQMLKLGRTVPRGVAVDWPRYQYRGVMLDMGRHYYSVDYVLAEIRRMAWSKLDTLHLHLTDQNAFRLVSDTYPGLAAPQSYSHADIAKIVDYAQRYHVDLVPEIDVPAHDVPIAGVYDKSLQWDCPSMNASAYEPWPGYTLDITKPAATTFVSNLLKEFVPLFRNSTVFHLGGDEYPEQAAQAQCPELVAYAKANGYASTEDVFVTWLNQMGQLVRSLGKRPEIWNWWDVAGGATIAPDHDLIIDAWTGTADAYLNAGYDTVSSPSDLLYVTPSSPPGGNLEPDDPSLYQQWTPQSDPHLLGYEVSRWSDNAADQSDAYFDWFAHRPEQVVADRIWGGPRAYASAYAFEDAADRVGGPPGTPGFGVRLSGTPYGTSPPWSPPSSYDKAFDGDPDTFFDFSQGSGGYTGIDLGSAHPVGQIRFIPRYVQRGRMVGGTFQGCTDGPTTGCHPLSTVNWTPTADWNVLTVNDPTPYRWLRYVGPTGGFCNVAEIQFYGR